jgi:tetraprenyl-beta-curcumene synthase
LLDARSEPERARTSVSSAVRLSSVCSRALLVVKAWAALLVANFRYWRTVAAVADERIEHWRSRAEAIPDEATRTLALSKLDGERFNAEAGAMLATFAPAPQRANVVEAIVSLQLLFDLLDGLSERPTKQPIEDGHRLFALFIGALSAETPKTTDSSLPAAGYMGELAEACRRALTELPATAAVLESARSAAARAATGQIHMHAASRLGIGQLQQWAQQLSSQSSLPWRELTAGAASSVLCVHALIAAAADPDTDSAQAVQIDWAYLSICVLLTLLDSLTDREQDARDAKLGYVDLYDDGEQLSKALDASLARADAQVRRLPDPERHLMMLAGVVAYYASAPGAKRQGVAEQVARLRDGLQPVIAPTMLVMRLWRACRRRQGRV